MADTSSRARSKVESVAAQLSGIGTIRAEVIRVLGDLVDFDAFVWLLTDPVTAVGAAPFADVPCLPELPMLIRSKYMTRLNRWTALAHAPTPVATLSDATAGHLADSLVWREVMSRYDVCDVASVVFADDYGCWGFLDLWRTGPHHPFGASEIDILRDIVPAITTGLRRCQAGTFADHHRSHTSRGGPVVLTLSEDLRIITRTAESRTWLDILLPPSGGSPSIPASVYNVAAQLLALEQGVDDHKATTRVHLDGGVWLTLRAGRLPSDADQPAASPGTIVVTIEQTNPSDRLELFARAFALTPRESDLLDLLGVGADTRSMAATMQLSQHTVQDHFKSIFAKTGSHDRISVLSRALGT